jgi:hypothetical protein
MNYAQLISDFNDGTLDKDTIQLVMDNDCSYFTVLDSDMSDEEKDKVTDALEKKYGSSNGYEDIVAVLQAAGVNCEWC